MRLEVDVSARLGAFNLDARFDSDSRVVALFGRSGAGKTTLANAIAGILRPARGRIALDGQTLFDSATRVFIAPENRRIGYVFQDSLLFPHLDVRDNLMYGRKRCGDARQEARPETIIDLLGLQPLLARRPVALSGGEKQRVAIGRALLAAPRLLIMDEPLASLDQERRGEILKYVERLRDELDMPIVYISHSVGEVSRLADTLVVLSGGGVVADGPIEDVMNRLDLRPQTGRFEAGSLVDTHVLSHDAAYGLTTLQFPGGELVLPRFDANVGDRVRVRIRARDVSLATERPNGISIVNILEGRLVETSDESGPIIETRIQVGDASLSARITRRSAQALNLRIGQPVFALVKAVSLDRRSVGFG